MFVLLGWLQLKMLCNWQTLENGCPQSLSNHCDTSHSVSLITLSSTAGTKYHRIEKPGAYCQAFDLTPNVSVRSGVKGKNCCSCSHLQASQQFYPWGILTNPVVISHTVGGIFSFLDFFVLSKNTITAWTRILWTTLDFHHSTEAAKGKHIGTCLKSLGKVEVHMTLTANP